MFLSKMYESPPQPVNLNFVCKLVEFCFKSAFCIVSPFSYGLENVAHLKKGKSIKITIKLCNKIH